MGPLSDGRGSDWGRAVWIGFSDSEWAQRTLEEGGLDSRTSRPMAGC